MAINWPEQLAKITKELADLELAVEIADAGVTSAQDALWALEEKYLLARDALVTGRAEYSIIKALADEAQRLQMEAALTPDSTVS